MICWNKISNCSEYKKLMSPIIWYLLYIWIKWRIKMKILFLVIHIFELNQLRHLFESTNSYFIPLLLPPNSGKSNLYASDIINGKVNLKKFYNVNSILIVDCVDISSRFFRDTFRWIRIKTKWELGGNIINFFKSSFAMDSFINT